MYPRSINNGSAMTTMHGGGGVETISAAAPRTALPPAPTFNRHWPQQHQIRRSSPPPPPPLPYHTQHSANSMYGHPESHYPPPPSQHYPPVHRQIYAPPEYNVHHDSHYPPTPQYYRHDNRESIHYHRQATSDRNAYRDDDPIYNARMMGGAPLYEQAQTASAYRPSARPSGSFLADSIMMRGPQAFYEKTGDQCPTYIGYIKSAQDAILLLSACDLAAAKKSPSSPSSNSAIPPPRRVTRRLLDAERADMVASGCVFAWDEKEAGMKRWTDGRVWSASRVSGCFLTYRELEARKKSNSNALDGPTSNQYKPEGLIKQSFSVTTASGRKLHVISYFTKRDVREGRLRRVSEDPRFVGEGGGEWGLKVDKEEYSFPDGQSRVPGQEDQGVADDDDDDEDDDSDGLNTPSPQPESHAPSRKRSLPDDFVEQVAQPAPPSKQQHRPPLRPILIRKRSSSLSQLASSSCDNPVSKGSFQSSSSGSSNVTSVYSDSAAPRKSHVVRALVSPTLPRESAVRGSACDMHPTHSQDSANAVGALLSLAGNRLPTAAGAAKTGPSPLSGSVSSAGDQSDNLTVATSATPSSSASGLGLTVKPSPERRDSDQTALDMFRVRL